jgi:hypothetical protein
MYTFVTSFTKKHYDIYGEKFLKSVADNWSNDLRLVVYVEGYDDTEELPLANFASNIEYRHIEHIEDRNSFIERNKDKTGIVNGEYNYRYDAIRFCHKVYAYSDLAYELIDQEYKGWLAWIDADTITTGKFTAKDAENIMREEDDIVHLGRIDIDYSETGFIAWNLTMQNAASQLVDVRGAYDTDEVFGYREWTDAFVFTRLLKIYEAHRTRVRNLSEGVRGLAVFENSILKDYFEHNKGNLKFTEQPKQEVSKDVQGPQRYKKLAALMRHYSQDLESYSVVEVGTWNGGRAVEMALAAFDNVDKFHYRGFDLFEQATDETDKEELNVKAHNSLAAVEERLTKFAAMMKENGKEFTFRLIAGNTRDTMKGVRFDDVDFAYIDGGHSYETVKSDYSFLKHVPVVVFDDYYSTQDDKGIPEEHQGVIKVYKDATNKRKKVLPSEDKTAFGGIVHLAVVLSDNKSIKDLPADLIRVPILVKPKDCMPDDDIRGNIEYNVEKIDNFDWVKHYKATDEHAIVVSGGTIDFFELKRVIKETGGKVFCVKHSYPKLLANDIKPFGCVILDPRPLEGESTHGVVRKSLFKKIDKTTKFFIASMTDKSVTDYIMDKTDNVLGFHAFTDAIRDKSVTDRVQIDYNLPIKKGELLISGGTCAATRTVGLLETLGYRNIHMFGFDCSVTKEKAEKNKEEKDALDQPKYLHVETGGVQFHTTGELLALAQDLEKMFERKDLNLNIRFYGTDTLAAQVFKQSYYNTEYKTFEEWTTNA